MIRAINFKGMDLTHTFSGESVAISQTEHRQSLTLGAHAQRGLLYLVCVPVCPKNYVAILLKRRRSRVMALTSLAGQPTSAQGGKGLVNALTDVCTAI